MKQTFEKFEYMIDICQLSAWNDLEELLNNYYAPDGWELCGTYVREDWINLIFKRPKT